MIGIEEFMGITGESEALNSYGFVKVKDMSNDDMYKLLRTVYEQESEYADQCRKDNTSFSITGGYCRNHLLGVNTPTDIDVITDNLNGWRRAFIQSFKREEWSVPETFIIPGNTMHLLSDSITRTIDGNTHSFIRPMAFDFTINLSCLSVMDGYMYVPPITLFDLEHKILRPIASSCMDFAHQSGLLDTSMALRGIRFALKYDLALHDTFVNGIKVLFTVQKRLNMVRDKSVFNVLRHLVTQETSEFRDRFYSVLRSPNFIDTDNYTNFDDYFQFITWKCEHMPREEAFRTNCPRHSGDY